MMEIAVLIQQHIMDAYLGHSHKVLGQRGKESLEVQANYANHISAFRPCLLVPLHLCNAFVVAVAHVTDRHTHTHPESTRMCSHEHAVSIPGNMPPSLWSGLDRAEPFTLFWRMDGQLCLER